jgi:hypothetical protein
LTSCAKKELYPAEYISWVDSPESSLSDKKIIGDYEFTVQYKPADYLALRELKHQEPTSALLAEKSKAYQSLHYFVFKIATIKHDKDIIKTVAQSPEDYQQVLAYFISGIKDDFTLLEGDDTLACKFQTFERTYNIEPYTTFIVAFDREPKDPQNLTFIYDDKILGCGPVSLKFDKSILTSIPTIKTER